MYVLRSNGYISEDSLILFEEILHLIENCLVRCRTFRATCFFLAEVLYFWNVVKWVCAHVLNERMHIYMLGKNTS